MTQMKRAHPPLPSLHALDLNLLVALDALLAEGSVTAAAHRSGVTQSAMSHSLAKLRILLGDPLLVRTHAGMSPTPRARALAEPLTRALTELRSVLSSGTSFDARTSRRRFTIGTADYGALVVIPPLMKRLGREAPMVEVVQRPVPAAPADALEDERLDVVLSVQLEPRATLSAQKLFDERLVCVLRAGHPALARRRRALDLETFASLSHVQVAPRGSPGGVVDDLLARSGVSRHVALRVADFLVAPLVVAESDLVLTVPERVARVFAPSHGLAVVEPPESLPTFTMWMVWHERRRHDPAHAWLRGVVVG